MADQKVVRPLAPIPYWATDALINDPGEPWDGTPTKVEPGAGKRNDGFIPEEEPGAQHVNQLFAELTNWIQYLADVQVRNWRKTGLSIGGLENPAVLLYDDATPTSLGRWIILGDDAGTPEVWQSGVLEFASAMTITGYTDTITWAAVKSGREAPTANSLFVFGGPTNNDSIGVMRDSVITVINLSTNQNQEACAVYEPTNQRFLVGGWVNGAPDLPSVWRISTGAMPAEVDRITLPAGAVSTHVILLAHDGAGKFVALGEGTNADVWVSTDAGASWAVSATPIDDPLSLLYAPDLAKWFCLTVDKCYSSPDGTTWTLISTLTLVNGFGFFSQQFVAAGNLLVAPYDVGGASQASAVAYSTDSGVTWRLAIVGGSGNNDTRIAYSRDRGQFALVDSDGTDTNIVNVSMACGTSERKPDGTLSAPTL